MPTLHETVERYYTCPRCGAKGEVAFTAIGRGNAIDGTSLFIRLFAPRGYWWRADDLPALDAVSRAGAAQRQDAERTLGMIRCVACGKRPLGAFVWPAFRIALITSLGLFLTSLRFYLVGLPWWSGGAVFAAVQVVIEIAIKTLGSPRWDAIGGGVADYLIDRWRVELLLGGGAVKTTTVGAGVLGLASIGIDL